MIEKTNSLQKYAMRFGTYLGIYWIFDFMLFPLSYKLPFLQFLFVVLFIAAPFLGYKYVKMYRDKICGGYISFLNAYIFSIFMYLFASLLMAVAFYIYFQYIDHGFIIENFNKTITDIQALKPEGIENAEEFKEAQNQMTSIAEMCIDWMNMHSPIQLTMITIASNVQIGAIFAIPTALFVRKRNKNISTTM